MDKEIFEEDDSCKGRRRAHFYERVGESYICKYCGKTIRIKDIIEELDNQRGV